jgi:alpha-L-rhamnosidase
MKKYFALLLLSGMTVLSGFAQVSVKNLLCENLTNPIGLDVKEPRFSWQLVSDKRNWLSASAKAILDRR